MKFGAWTSVVLVACLLRKVEANNGLALASGVDTSSSFVQLAGMSSINMNLGATNASLNSLADSVKGLMTAAQTEDIQSAMDTLKALVQWASNRGLEITGTLTKLISDPTIPLSVLFEQFDNETQIINMFLNEEFSKITSQIEEKFGGARADQFTTSINDAISVFTKMAETVSQISQIVLCKSELRIYNRDRDEHEHPDGCKEGDRDRDVNPTQLKSLVDALAQSIKDFNTAIKDYATVVKSAVDGIEKSNKFLESLSTKEKMTRSDLNSTAIKTNTTANTQSTNTQNKYIAAQLAMKTDLTNALKGLNIFSSSRKLKRLVEENKKAYVQLYSFLRKRSQVDLSDIAEYYGKLGNKTANSINQTAEIFINAVHRTGLQLTDVALEGGSRADSCFATFKMQVPALFTPLSTFVSSCVMRETMRWTSIATAVEDMLKLVQMNSKELSINLGRCSSYANFATNSEDYVQAKACLKTNLEDLEDLPKVLEPQLQNVNQLVKREAKAGTFRIDNCLITNLHEVMAKLKYARAAIDICAGSDSNRPRKDRDDDEKEWHDREREHEDNDCKRVHDDDFRTLESDSFESLPIE